MYFLNETPSGTVDGANKTFTTANTLYQVAVIIVNGAIYGGTITYTGLDNTFTLGDAPIPGPQPILISYYDSINTNAFPGSLQVQDIYNLFQRYKKNINDVSQQLFLDWCNEVNRFAYRILYGTDPQRYVASATINVISGITTYNLPSDFLNMQPLGTGFFVTQNGVATAYTLPKTSFGSVEQGYYLTHDTFTLTPPPQQNTTLYQKYIPQLGELTSFTDLMVIPAEYIYYVRDAVDCLYDMWDEDVPAEGLANQRFNRALDELVRNINKDSKTVGIFTFNSSFYAPSIIP